MCKSRIAFIVVLLGVASALPRTAAGAQGRGVETRAERITTVRSSETSPFKESVRELVRDSATFRRLWRELDGAGRAPQIDFQSSIVILIAIGTRPSTGYEVHVRELRSMGNELHVFVDLIEPGPGCPVGAEVQAPATMIEAKLRVSTGAPPRILFHDRKLLSQCSPD